MALSSLFIFSKQKSKGNNQKQKEEPSRNQTKDGDDQANY